MSYNSDTHLVVIPTFNEIENIAEFINQILEFNVSLLIVDDNSPDGTGEFVETILDQSNKIHLLKRNSKLGLGSAYRDGFKWGLTRNYEYFIEMDADFSHDPNDLTRLYTTCVEGGDLAIGSRYANGVNIVNWPMSRLLMSYFASKYVKFVTGLPINDSTAGYKCYRREVLENINFDKIQFVGYAFQIEMKFKAWKYGFNVVEVPVIFTDRTEGISKMSSDIFFEAFIGVIQMKVRSWFRTFERKSNDNNTH